MQSNERKILAVVSGDLFGSGGVSKIVKYKYQNKIFLEIYKDDNQKLKFNSRIDLLDRRDGYFMFNGEATNLALDDLDKDNEPEILAPTYDDQLVAHLNIYKFNKEKAVFEKYQLHD